MMDQLAESPTSPFRTFNAEEWAQLRGDTPLTLSQEEVERLRAMGDPINLDEVRRIYLPLSRMLAMHVESVKTLFAARRDFLQLRGSKRNPAPFIIGSAGSVAVGKSTTARLLKELLKRWTVSPKVDLITTDGFLYPNAYLEAEGLMNRKGFPESYDVGKVLHFLSDIKSGVPEVQAPKYSHLTYDVLPDDYYVVDQPDILIFEGINVLQTRDLPRDGKMVPFVSDFLDFSIFVDAEESMIEGWYMNRFMKLWRTAFKDEKSFFKRFSSLSQDEAFQFGRDIWRDINLVNLHENIQPTRPRADLILRKGADHRVETVFLRKL